MIKYHKDVIQGSPEWHAARCGMLTASEMHLIITPTLKVASNEKERTHLFELLAQRVTQYVEPSYISNDMLRGQEDETEACALYARNYAPIRHLGFITNDRWGFELGYSPDGLVGEKGAIECKSRCGKYQMKTIVEGAVPDEFNIQLQTAMLVAELDWIDFVSYCGGLPMWRQRVLPNKTTQEAILEAAFAFEKKLDDKLIIYRESINGLIPTERRIVEEMYL